MAQKSYTARLSDEIDAVYEAYKKAEPDAEGRLYSALLVQARNIVFFRLQYHDEDVALEIVYRTLAALSKFRGKSKFSTWFYRLAKNEGYRALDTHIRKRKPEVHLSADPLGEASDEEPAAKPVNRDNAISLALLQRQLPKEQAEVIRLMAKDYSLEKIAEMTGESIGTIRSRYRLAKAALSRGRKNSRHRVI